MKDIVQSELPVLYLQQKLLAVVLRKEGGGGAQDGVISTKLHKKSFSVYQQTRHPQKHDKGYWYLKIYSGGIRRGLLAYMGSTRVHEHAKTYILANIW